MYYQFTVPVFMNSLEGLKNVLKKGEAFAEEKGMSEEKVLGLRLAPDMFPLVRQVQIACDNAKGATARLSGTENPKMEDNEKTFSELYARIDKTLAFINSVPESAFAKAAEQTITLSYFKGTHFTGDGYVRFYAIPNFFFHVTTAYDILRANGVPVGKMDYIGKLPTIKD
jgi:hypothetical protein